MKKKVFKICSILMSFFIIIGCNKKEDLTIPYRKTVYDVYNTSVVLTVYNQKVLNKVFPDFEKLARNLHKEYDRDNFYQDGNTYLNNLYQINQSYGSGNSIIVSDYLFDLLKLSMVMFELTEGYFNPALGSLIDLWAEKFSDESIYNTDPSQDSIERALTCVPTYEELSSILIMNEQTNEITFNALPRCQNKVVISLGAIAKGYSTDLLKEYYLSKSKVAATIDGGGSSLIAIGENPLERLGKDNKYDNYWSIGVNGPAPYEKENLFKYLRKGSMNVSTSGNAVQYFYLMDSGQIKYQDGMPIKRTHILNPYSGYSETFYDNLTIISTAPAAVLDALSTALYNIKDMETVQRIINSVESYYNVNIDFCFSKTVKADIENEDGSTEKVDRINVIINNSMHEQIIDINTNYIKSIEIK